MYRWKGLVEICQLTFFSTVVRSHFSRKLSLKRASKRVRNQGRRRPFQGIGDTPGGIANTSITGLMVYNLASNLSLKARNIALRYPESRKWRHLSVHLLLFCAAQDWAPSGNVLTQVKTVRLPISAYEYSSKPERSRWVSVGKAIPLVAITAAPRSSIRHLRRAIDDRLAAFCAKKSLMTSPTPAAKLSPPANMNTGASGDTADGCCSHRGNACPEEHGHQT